MAIGGNQFLQPSEVISLVNVREGDKIADLGCGSGGYFTIPFAHAVGVTGVVYAVDILPEALHTIENLSRQQNLTNIQTLHSNLELPGVTKIPKGSLDVAFLINVLFQNQKKEALLKEADSFVKKGGLVVVVDWVTTGGGFGPTQELLVDREEVKKNLLGYTQVVTAEIGEYHFIDVYKKQ